MSFELRPDEVGSDAVILKVSGELDISNVEQLEAAVQRLEREKARRLTIDAGDLRFADSSAIAQWVKWAAVFEEVQLRDPSPLLRRVVASMGLLSTLHLVP
ncbi:MAG: STAS domain-containing protein [Actinobacteria bacterium]|nr:STAS domain-containing protein [Actinomycetota bacterium]